MVTTFNVDSPEDNTAWNLPLPIDVQDPIAVNPVIIGLFPVPYASNVIGNPELPDVDGVMLP
jgi:hypothetical protein